MFLSNVRNEGNHEPHLQVTTSRKSKMIVYKTNLTYICIILSCGKYGSISLTGSLSLIHNWKKNKIYKCSHGTNMG